MTPPVPGNRTTWAMRRRQLRARIGVTAAVVGSLVLPVVPASAAAASCSSFGRSSGHPSVSAAGSPVPADAPAADSLEIPYPDLLPRVTAGADLNLSLTTMDPRIAHPGQAITITVNVSNTGSTSATVKGRVRVGSALVTRKDLDTPPRPQQMQTVVSDEAPLVLPAGTSAPMTLTILPGRLPITQSFGVFPVAIEVHRGDASATLSTFLPFERVKEYEPVNVSIAVPLTPDPEPLLLSADDAAREKTWASRTAPESRLGRILEATKPFPVTYAVDPTVLGPPPKPSKSSSAPESPSPKPSPTSSAPTSPAPSSAPSPAPTPSENNQENLLWDSPARKRFTEKLTAGTSGVQSFSHPVWELPSHDPDLTALDSMDPNLLRTLVSSDGQLSKRLSVKDPLRMAWPSTPLTDQQRSRLVAAYGAGSLGGVLLPVSSTHTDQGTGDAARRFGDGTVALGYDEKLSQLMANAAASSSAGLSQRFLAETMTILQEYPGRSRQVLIMPPRTFNPNPRTLQTLLTTMTTAPWVKVTSTSSLLSAARDRSAAKASVPKDFREPFSLGDSPVDQGRLNRVTEDLRRLDGVPAILPQGSLLPGAARQSQLALLSTRWRGYQRTWPAARDVATERFESVVGGVKVLPSQVNFFAESGVLQVTVVNSLDVDVKDVQLRLVSQGRNQRLRFPAKAQTVTVPAKSRATVRLMVEAVAAGQAHVSAEVRTPSGTRLGSTETTLEIQVQPTNGWLILVFSGAAGAVFLFGLLRTIRRNRPRVSAEDLKEINLS